MNKAMEAKEGKFRGRKGRLKTELSDASAFKSWGYEEI